MSQVISEVGIETLRNRFSRRMDMTELVHLAADIEKNRYDVVTPSKDIEFELDDNGIYVVAADKIMRPTAWASSQMYTWSKMGKYGRFLQDEDPELLVKNLRDRSVKINDMRMLRGYGTDELGFVSNRFDTLLSNYLMVKAAIPALITKGWNITEASITETRMFIRANMPTLEGEIRVGDVVNMGLIFSNSEVGKSSFKIDIELNRLICSNLMTVPDSGLRKVHLGVSQEAGLFSRGQETSKKLQAGFTYEVIDIVDQLTSPKTLENVLQRVRKTTEVDVASMPATVSALSKELQASVEEEEQLLMSFIGAKDQTGWGVVNAITDVARDMEDYDRKTSWEEYAGFLSATDKGMKDLRRLSSVTSESKRRRARG